VLSKMIRTSIESYVWEKTNKHFKHSNNIVN
jgi:hypothetical protein